MGKKHIAKKVEWGFTSEKQFLFEKREDCWHIVGNFQTIHKCVNGRNFVDVFPVRCEWLGLYLDTRLSLDSDMISINNKVCLDNILNPIHSFSQDRMSNPKQNIPASIEVVEIRSGGSSSTLDSTHSSYETVDTRDLGDNIPIEVDDNPSSMPSTSSTSIHLPVASVAPSSRNSSFEDFTVKVATPINPSTPRTIYAGVTNTGFSIHDLVHAGSLSKSPEDGDFVLKLNTAEPIDLCCIYSLVDRTKYKLKIIPALVFMSNYFILVPTTHFLNGRRFLLDRAFVDFLHSVYHVIDCSLSSGRSRSL